MLLFPSQVALAVEECGRSNKLRTAFSCVICPLCSQQSCIYMHPKMAACVRSPLLLQHRLASLCQSTTKEINKHREGIRYLGGMQHPRSVVIQGVCVRISFVESHPTPWWNEGKVELRRKVRQVASCLPVTKTLSRRGRETRNDTSSGKILQNDGREWHKDVTSDFQFHVEAKNHQDDLFCSWSISYIEGMTTLKH